MRPPAIDSSTSAIKAARRWRPSAFRLRFNSRAFAARPRDMSAMPSVIELMALANVLSLQSRHRSLASAARSRERLWAAACASLASFRSRRRAVNPERAMAKLQSCQLVGECPRMTQFSVASRPWPCPISPCRRSAMATWWWRVDRSTGTVGSRTQRDTKRNAPACCSYAGCHPAPFRGPIRAKELSACSFSGVVR